MLPIVTATGNLAADAQLGYANNGTPVLNFTLYCNGVANGNDKHVERVKCAVWGKQAESLSPILKKGMPVTVTGQCITEPYKTNAGEVAANFKINRAEVGLINTGNGNGAPAAADNGEVPVVIANGAVSAPTAMSVPTSVPSGDPMANGLPPVMSQPPF